jgi:hypothetical protein
MAIFLSGLITGGYLVAGLFFAKFWARSRDPLFATFAAAFWLLALDEVALAFVNISHDNQSWTFLLRLAAFTLLAVAVAYKNAVARRWALPRHR